MTQEYWEQVKETPIWEAKIRKSLKRLGMNAHFDKHIPGLWLLITFDSEEDLNFYKLTDEYEPNSHIRLVARIKNES